MVSIYAVGEASGVLFLAMPLLEGESLADRLKRVGRLDPPELQRLAVHTSRGLTAAHSRGLIHRDIKPGNLWIEPTSQGERVKILDFGLARPAGESGETLTESGFVPGTPAYMSPEQVRDEPLDARSDLFSLGAVLYEAATGIRAFPGSGSFVVCRNVVDLTPFRPHEIAPSVPVAMSNQIMRLLAKRPDERPASATEVAERFTGQTSTVPPPVAERTSRRVWIAASVLLAGLVAVASLVANGQRNPDPTETQQAIPNQSSGEPKATGTPAVVAATNAPVRVAIVVGVNEYENRALGVLNYAEADAKDLAAALRKLGYEVRLLLGSSKSADRATGENIRKAITEETRRLGKADLLVIAMSGTGYQYPVANTQETTPTFCPVDADPYEPKSMLSVVDLTGTSSGPSVIIFSDACRNYLFADLAETDTAPRTIKVRDGAVIFFACQKGQFALEGVDEKHGVFSGALLDVLSGKSWDHASGKLFWDSLVSQVESRVHTATRGKGQIPEVAGKLPSGFVFAASSAGQ